MEGCRQDDIIQLNQRWMPRFVENRFCATGSRVEAQVWEACASFNVSSEAAWVGLSTSFSEH